LDCRVPGKREYDLDVMRQMHNLLCVLLLSGTSCFVGCSSGGARVTSSRLTTAWELKPSLKYDALSLLNALSGDSFYLKYYQHEYDHFHPLFSPEEQAAFVQLKRVIKDEGRGIVSATLTLYYSASDDETLPEMIRTAHDPSRMKAALQETPYWIPDAWRNFERATPALETALRALDRVGFADYWASIAKPRVEKRIAELSPELPKYDIVPTIERRLGFPLPSHTITIYLLAYSEPHGIRVTGLRFLTHVSYPFDIVLHNAIHESMHPPYDMKDAAVRRAVELLERDPLITDKVAHHDSSFGYNSASGLIEEDSVEALEQIVSEDFGVGRYARVYWFMQDGGMHVLAPAIYVQYKQALSQHPQPYSQWFVEATESGHLRGSELKRTVRNFFFYLRGW
jgi:hypothetical protein